MELGTEIFRTRGRATRNISASIVRELERADLELLATEKGSKSNAIKRITDRHHALARLLARGHPPSQAAAIAGYCLSRVSVLQDDPAFRELLEFYRSEVDVAFRGVDAKLAGVASDALDLLQERLEEEPDKVSTNQLMEVVKLGADRTGFGPQSSSMNMNVNVNMADKLEAARRRVQMRKLEVIEGSKND